MSDQPLTLTDAAAALRAGTTTSVALTEHALAQADRLDAQLGTYLARFDEHALGRAAAVDAELSESIDKGPLHGIPIGVKDILAMAEGPTTAQSLVLDPAWGHGKDAIVVERLKAAGAVITGKVTTMEFACGMPDHDKPFPIPRNPWDPARWAGGSSSGSGAGVAAGLFLAAVGTDTAGSIRIPAAYADIDAHGLGAILGNFHTQYWDTVGNPVIVLPMGFTGDGLPLSLQLGARPFEEALIVRAGDAFQGVTDWHLRIPPLAA
jgi:aspartyl-tRNA(Asn)/glutamyl-tRNA(Gln) amidotransferase subunit A